MTKPIPGHYRVVLVRPEVAGNIGATARVLRNYGLRDFVLVDPKADHMSPEAVQRSTRGAEVLSAARLASSLDEALSGCVSSVAFSSFDQGVVRRGMAGTLESVVGETRNVAESGPVALVFGPEPSGLSTSEVGRCDHLATIPADPEYPSFNLSHAVAIALYEIARQSLVPSSGPPESLPASDDHRERMLVHLRKALEDVHFLWDEKADLLFHGIRQIIVRARPTANDIQILHGLARQLEWVVRNGYRIPDDKV